MRAGSRSRRTAITPTTRSTRSVQTAPTCSVSWDPPRRRSARLVSRRHTYRFPLEPRRRLRPLDHERRRVRARPDHCEPRDRTRADWQPSATHVHVWRVPSPGRPRTPQLRQEPGQTIPIKYRLLTTDGTPVSDPAHFTGLESRTIRHCVTSRVDAIETYAGESGLRYLGDGYWQFNWKTSKSMAGQCRVASATFADGNT